MRNTKHNYEITELIKSLDENSVDLTNAMNTVRVLDELEITTF